MIPKNDILQIPTPKMILRLLDTDLGSVMKAADDFQWDRINFILEARARKAILCGCCSTLAVKTCQDFSSISQQVKGETVEDFIAKAQDRSRNALATSLLAAFGAFKEQLGADQVAFESEKILYLELKHFLQVPFLL